MFSAFDGSLRSLLDFLFFLKQCVPTAAVSLSALAYKLVHKLAVSHLCTVQVVHMFFSSSATERFTLLACMHWLQHGGRRYSLFNALQTLSKPRKVEADTLVVINNNFLLSFTPSILGWDITGFKHPYAS